MNSKLYPFFVGLVFVLLSYGTYQGMVGAPTEQTMGDAQRIFYYHVPAAAVAYTLFTVNFIASLLFLWKRTEKSDVWAAVSAEVGLVFATVVLITGPIWGRFAWNTWWAWEPRLITFLILWLLYVSYLVLRKSAEGGAAPVLAAALAIFAFVDVPLSYLASQFFMLRGHHPTRVITTPGGLDPHMAYAFGANMIAFFAFAGLILWFRYELEEMARRINHLHIQKATSGVAAMMALPAMFLFQAPERQNLNPTHFMYAAYISAWIVYIAYLLFLMTKVAKLKREEAELRTGR
jgi:heme exporter protein C